MAELTANQLELINASIQSQVTDSQLQIELLDHCCCLIEHQLDEGVDFNRALQQALFQLHHQGLQAVESDLYFSLNQIIPILMKKLLYFSGFFCALTLSTGLLMRFMHWKGGDVMLLLGHLFLFISMINLFIQLLRFPAAFKGITYFRMLSGVLSGMLIAVGATFKIFHWPTANIQFASGMILFTTVFVPLFFWQLYQRELRSERA